MYVFNSLLSPTQISFTYRPSKISNLTQGPYKLRALVKAGSNPHTLDKLLPRLAPLLYAKASLVQTNVDLFLNSAKENWFLDSLISKVKVQEPV